MFRNLLVIFVFVFALMGMASAESFSFYSMNLFEDPFSLLVDSTPVFKFRTFFDNLDYKVIWIEII